MKILVAEGDADLSGAMVYSLARRGYDVASASTTGEAREVWNLEKPDVVVIGSTVGGSGSLQLCRYLRAQAQIPIVLVATRGEEDVVAAFESGADDYMVRPFTMRQLIVRIDALLRRPENNERIDGAEPRLSLGDLVIDPSRYLALKNGCALKLTRTEFRILYYLLGNAGFVVSFERLYRYAWRHELVGDYHRLKTHMSRLRRKLAAAGGAPVTIRATSRTGYVLSL